MEGCSFAVFANTASTLRTLTLKDHLVSKKHAAKKEARNAKSSSSEAPSTSSFPNVATIASYVIWIPIAFVDVERSFSQYGSILNDRRESLTEENTKRFVMLYYNGDIVGHFCSIYLLLKELVHNYGSQLFRARKTVSLLFGKRKK